MPKNPNIDPRRKLTLSQTEEIKVLLKQKDVSQREIARMYDVNYNIVYEINKKIKMEATTNA